MGRTAAPINEAALIRDWRDGLSAAELRAKYDIETPVLQSILRRHGVRSNRTATRSPEEVVRGLMELAEYQDRRIMALEAENAQLRRQLGVDPDGAPVRRARPRKIG